MSPQIRAAVALSFLFASGIAVRARAEEHALSPYVDPAQLDVPWPRHSDYRQPWRAFLETRSGAAFLQGIGINYNVPANEGGEELPVRLLAESGFRTFRIEVGWGSVKWDETGLNGSEHLLRLLRLCKQFGIRPTMLLNANHGVPCPTRFFEKHLAADAAEGDTSIKLTDTDNMVAGYSGLNSLSPHSYWACEAIITTYDPISGGCILSKPLPADLKKDAPVKMATLKYLPLYPVGTPHFEETAQGWLKYAGLVTGLAAEAGIDEFDVELWNELSFGSNFANIDHYYDPPIYPKAPNFLLPGGSAWELSRLTAVAIKKEHPAARIIWGWSNTTFYRCPIEKLPPGINGQSYHPYGTGTRTLPKDEDQPAAVATLKTAVARHGIADVLVAVERTGRYHHAPMRAFAAGGFETRTVHPLISKHFREMANPAIKTDDRDLAGICLAAINGFALAEPAPDEFWRQFQLLTRHRRDLVRKASTLCCQIKEHLEASLPGYAACFPTMWDHPAAMVLALQVGSVEQMRQASRAHLRSILREAKVGFQDRTLQRVSQWAAAAAPGDIASSHHRRIAADLENDRERKA